MELEVFVTLGMGDNSFLVASGDEAIAVDPQRDAWRFLETAERRGWTIRYVTETHVHNDYVSGAHEIREATGAEIVAHARSGYGFPFHGVLDGDELTLGDLRVVAWETPGHTFEHVAWAVHAADGGDPGGVFTGGSLLVGSAGRSDLLGLDRAEELARAQYRSAQRIGRLPDTTRILPTHGAGSFCVAALPSAERSSTLGTERVTNMALLAPDEDTFVREHLTGLMEHPRYYARMAPINRAGPSILGALPQVPLLSPAEIAAEATTGALLIDARDRVAFAEAHIPGSINIELNEAFGSYVGWVTPFDAPHVLILPEPLDASLPDALAQLIRIGYGRTLGYLGAGIDAWVADGRTTASYPVATTKDLRERLEAGSPPRLLDVRQPGEWQSEGVVPGSVLVFVGDLPDHLATIPRHEELWVLCTNGHRASIAASLLDREGIGVRLVAKSGILGLLAHVVGHEEVSTG
jgi:hydroxyacylglutathione hydrolase